MFSTCPSVRSFVRPSVRCQSCERDICLKTNDPISLQIGTSGLLGQGDEAVNIGGQEVKVQGHTTPSIDLATWRRHRSRPLRSSRLCYCRIHFNYGKSVTCKYISK